MVSNPTRQPVLALAGLRTSLLAASVSHTLAPGILGPQESSRESNTESKHDFLCVPIISLLTSNRIELKNFFEGLTHVHSKKKLQYQFLCSYVVFLPFFVMVSLVQTPRLPIAIIASRLDLTFQALEATVSLGHGHLLGVHGDGVHHFGEPWGSAAICEGRLQSGLHWGNSGRFGEVCNFLNHHVERQTLSSYHHSLYRLEMIRDS